MPPVTAGQIQAQVSAIRKRNKNGARVYALRAPDGWQGPDRLHIDGAEHLVLPCISDLQAREALSTAERMNQPLILLCTVPAEQLGDDVVSRFARQRVLTPHLRDVLAELFSARLVDPRVLTTKPLCDALMERAPASGYTPVSSGTLDLQYAWSVIMEHVVGIHMDSPSLSQVMEWSLDPGRIKALVNLDAPLLESFVDWFARSQGESIRFVMAAARSGLGSDLVPLGLVLGLVFSPELQKDPAAHAGRARLEKYFGGKEIDPESARAWYRAAEGAVLRPSESSGAVPLRTLLNRVDQLLADLKVQEHAHLSDYSPAGLSARFDRLGKSLQKVLKAKNPTGLEDAQLSLGSIRRHVLAAAEEDRLGRAEMGIRLIRWLHGTSLPKDVSTLPGLATFYQREGEFLDWARNRLRETDVSSPLQQAFQQTLRQVDERLVPLELQFAERLAEWTRNSDESDRLICIEDVLARVVLPLAKEQPVLLLVLDGMSVAVFRQLIRDIERQNWSELINPGLSLPSPILATIPSVTQMSRRALFLGRLDASTSGTEKGEFANQDLLFKATGSQVRPQLFLKGDLQDDGQGGLAEGVRSAIADKKGRVVGVVVNAVDDHLDSGDQVVFTWGLDRIKPLRELLKLAADADRVVIMTSDHGHVLDFGSRQLAVDGHDAGDRYRSGPPPVAPGEMVFEGPRVKRTTGRDRVTLAYSADIRYGPKKRGYHGGANPQEMVVPLAILAAASAPHPAGWHEDAPYEPDWWRGLPGVRLDQPAERALPSTVKIEAAHQGLELFERVPAVEPQAGASWLDAFFASSTYQEQLKLAVRGGPSQEVMTIFLETLMARGGSVMKAPLAAALGVPLFRVDGMVQNISRILNVDGYEVLAFDRASDTITLSVSLLKTQFEMD